TAFEDNVANAGGGIHFSGGAPVVRRTTFVANRGPGALAFADGSAGVVEDALFEQNTGSAAYVEESSPVFRRTTFRDNVVTLAGYDGAGAPVDGGAPLFEDCLFEDLRTRADLGDGGGGGVHVRAPSSAPAFVRTTFRNNTANHGGGTFVSDGSALFLFCRFEGNRAL